MQTETIKQKSFITKEEKPIVTDTFEAIASRITEVIHIALGQSSPSRPDDEPSREVTPQRILEIYKWNLLNLDGYGLKHGELTIEEVYTILEKTFFLWIYRRNSNEEGYYSTITSVRTQW